MYKYPQWQEPLAAAILEFSPDQVTAKVRTAEQAIRDRMDALKFDENSEAEVRALFDGLSILRGLQRDRLPSSGTRL
jgi:hypothetical protein